MPTEHTIHSPHFMACKKHLENLFEMQIKALTGLDFEQFVKLFYMRKYDIHENTPIREVKDEGSDIIIEAENMIVACYGAQEINKKSFERKAKDDFKKFENHWKDEGFTKWVMVINQKVAPEYYKIVKRLFSNSTVVGLTQLVDCICNRKEISSSARRELATMLYIPKEFQEMDYVCTFLDDLLRRRETAKKKVFYDVKKRVKIEEKIRLNYKEEKEIVNAINKYNRFVESGTLKLVENVMSNNYSGAELDLTKEVIIEDFNEQSDKLNKLSYQLSFKQELNALKSLYISRYKDGNTQELSYIIDAVLINLFEQCLIGKKTEDYDIPPSRERPFSESYGTGSEDHQTTPA